ncbi:MAG: hypothetical protein ACI9KS_002479 [Sulfitobacter sp.]|jgi:hypothetical protein
MSSFTLKDRTGDAPETGLQPPQLQFSDTSPSDVYQAMADWFFSTFPLTREEPTRISVPTSRALWLDESVTAPRTAFMPPAGSREFAHLHADGSFHLVMAEADENEVIAKGWGLHHPWKDRGVNEILVYAPRNADEIEQLKPVIEASLRFATRSHPHKLGLNCCN